MVNPAALEATFERGVDISALFTRPWNDEIVNAADVVITIGCGDACPVRPSATQRSPQGTPESVCSKLAFEDPCGLTLSNSARDLFCSLTEF
jgi:protein-tyrosine-phosphatase